MALKETIIYTFLESMVQFFQIAPTFQGLFLFCILLGTVFFIMMEEKWYLISVPTLLVYILAEFVSWKYDIYDEFLFFIVGMLALALLLGNLLGAVIRGIWKLIHRS